MRKPRLLSMILAAVMLFTCCLGTHLVTAVAATGTEPTFTVTSGTGKPGENVTLTVNISNNPGICAALIKVNYEEGLTLKSATDSKLLANGIFDDDLADNPFGLYWEDGTNCDNSSNGTLVTLVFTINENAANGDYKVWITYDQCNIYNMNLDDVYFECVPGKITVTGGACSHKFTNYVSDGNATCQADGTKTATCENGCGAKDTISDTGSKKAHSYTNYVSNGDATCEENGTETAACDYNCGNSDTRVDADSKLGHKYTNYISDGNATCTADGTETAECDNGCGKTDTRTDADSKLGHKYTNYEYQNDATYFADGTEKAHCDYNCGTTDTRTKVGSKLIDTALPTGEIKVKENGWKSFLNTISFGLCYKEKVDVTITAQDNETGIDTIEYYKSSAEISEDGIKNVTGWTSGNAFSVESEGQYIIYVKITDKAGNVAYISTNGIVVDTTAPLIAGVENGKSYCEAKTFTVSDDHLDNVTVNSVKTTDYTLTGGEYTIVATDKAGNTVTVKVNVFDGHSYTDYKSNNDATCQADGTKTATCDNDCGSTNTVADAGSRKTHSYTNYVSNNDATCTADGTETAACVYNCGKTDTRTDADSKLGHKYTNYVSDNNATCQADGTKTAACDNGCGKSNTVADTGSRKPHSYTNYVSNNDATCEADGTETAACVYNCGKTDTRTDVDSKLGHDWELTSTDPATCTEDGKEHYTCKNDSEHTKEETITALGHTFGEWTVTKAATSTEAGEKTHSCTVTACGYAEKVEIPAIVAEIAGVTNGIWEINKSESLSVKVNGEFGDVLEVKVDGTVVDKNSYVAETAGSTVTFKAEYLNALSAGKHNITVKYTDGETSTEVEVKAAVTTDREDTEDPDIKSPQTGDNSNIILWIALACVSLAALFVLTFLSRRKVNHR